MQQLLSKYLLLLLPASKLQSNNTIPITTSTPRSDANQPLIAPIPSGNEKKQTFS